MNSLSYKQISAVALREFLPAIADHGFSEIDRSCFYVRRAEEVVHVAIVEKSRHAPRVRVQLQFWVPEFSHELEPSAKLTDHLAISWARVEKLNSYSLGPERWWGIATQEEAIASMKGLISPFLRGAIPWFAKVSKRIELMPMLLPDTPDWIRQALSTSIQAEMPLKVSNLPVWRR